MSIRIMFRLAELICQGSSKCTGIGMHTVLDQNEEHRESYATQVGTKLDDLLVLVEYRPL